MTPQQLENTPKEVLAVRYENEYLDSNLMGKSIADHFLAGYEANQSKWIQINSSYDLPKDNNDYWAVDKKGNVNVKHGFTISIRNTTHYQAIVKPLPPKP